MTWSCECCCECCCELPERETFRVMVDRARTSDAIVQVVELDDPTVVFENLPALVSRIELEPRASTTSTSRGSAIERGENLDSIPLRQTVRSRGPPHRSLRQDWKRFLAASIGRYACATFEESPSSRLAVLLLTPCASRVIPGRPLS